jgi:phage portal protein BeeE
MLARKPTQQRADPAVPFQAWADMMLGYGGLSYTPSPNFTMSGHKQEEIAHEFMGYVHGAYRSNGIIFALVITRMLLLSEARFQFRRFINGRPTDFFGKEDLSLLEKPYGEGSTTRNLLADMSTDADLAGNFYAYRERGRLWRMRPDWVTVLLGSQSEAQRDPRDRQHVEAVDAWDAEVVGYVYSPGGPNSGQAKKAMLPEQVVHYAPYPSKMSRYLGMSWIQAVVQETMADKAAMTHKQMFFENGATANMVVSLHESITDPADFNAWVEAFEQDHEGALNAYRTIYLGAGADASVVGADMQQLDFKVTQGHGETRLAAAARMPAILVGIIAGLEAATYSNYGMARRAAADMTLRPTWGLMAGALSRVVPVPSDAELWYDVRDVSFLQEDAKDDAEIQQIKAQTINTLIMAGFEPQKVVDAVTAFDLERLDAADAHTGMISVQMHKPGESSEKPALPSPPNGNGSGPPEQVPAPPA